MYSAANQLWQINKQREKGCMSSFDSNSPVMNSRNLFTIWYQKIGPETPNGNCRVINMGGDGGGQERAMYAVGGQVSLCVAGNDDHDRSRSMIAIIMMIDDRSMIDR